MHDVAIPRSAAATPEMRDFSSNDLYEIIAISVLAPASWLVPHRLWDFVSVALSSAIAFLRPDIEPGARVELDVRASLLAGEVVKPPFVKR